MPKRTREQQDAHNERRRIVNRQGRKAIVCMEYIKAKHPNIHDEACGFFDIINQRYPRKRDLTTTHEFNLIKNQRMVEPQLNILLIPNSAITTTKTNHVTTTEEIPPVTTTEEIPPVTTN